MKNFFAIWLLSFAIVLPGRGQDDPVKSIYQTLSKFGHNVRNTYTEDSDDRPSPTPRRHRKSTSKHSSSKKSTAKHSGPTGDSSDQETDASDKKSNSKPDSGSSEEGKQDGSRTASGEEKAKSNPSPTPDEGAGSDSANKSDTNAPMATIKPEALREFSEQPPEVQSLIRNALALTEQNLGYKYGSADPGAGGMDCSGFIYYELGLAGFKDVPRDSGGQYEWVRKSGGFHAVLSRSGDSFELNDLKPGDLLFWSGTYKVDRDIPISHVMIYLGKEKSTDKPVMVGSTDGRSYEGVRRFGVSVFDFKMPSGKPNKGDPELTAKFEGYASIPGLRKADGAPKSQVSPEPTAKKEEEVSVVKPKAKPTPDLGNGD
jgi:cell wall-associated NlpC family hydrolase